jgi:2-polyprenyl-3-methyl-5-hydroxy-6-metoxy-1,4-benzoquinol methylase
MTERFDAEQVFDEDYLYFYETFLKERDDVDVGLIMRLGSLTEGTEVLDVPCGHGRISNALASLGCSVVGLDQSELFLEQASRDAKGLDVAVEYVRGDMRAVPWDGRFDCVVNWFTSFGYHEDEADRAVLAGFRTALKPGGRLLLEHMNRERMLRSLPAPHEPPRVLLTERGDDLMIDRVRYEASTGCAETERIIVRGGRVRRAHFRIRLFTAPELRDWLVGAGFSSVEFFGREGEPFTVDSARLVAVAVA